MSGFPVIGRIFFSPCISPDQNDNSPGFVPECYSYMMGAYLILGIFFFKGALYEPIFLQKKYIKSSVLITFSYINRPWQKKMVKYTTTRSIVGNILGENKILKQILQNSCSGKMSTKPRVERSWSLNFIQSLSLDLSTPKKLY